MPPIGQFQAVLSKTFIAFAFNLVANFQFLGYFGTHLGSLGHIVKNFEEDKMNTKKLLNLAEVWISPTKNLILELTGSKFSCTEHSSWQAVG